MINLYSQLTGFVFIFSIIAIIGLAVSFISVFFSTPPKPFEMTMGERLTYGLLLSYIISYLIYF
jgi:hypothetical protein